MSGRASPSGGSTSRTLLLAGNTLHVRDDEGRYCTHEALARQLDQWFAEFDRIVIAAVLDPGLVPAGFAAYAPADITFVPLAKAGGTGVRAKLGALLAAASWIDTLIPLLRRADVVHLRSPCNITVVGIPLARLLSPHRYAVYAGAWDAPPGGPRSYSLQRWMLRHFGGVVHVYAPASPSLAPNLRPNFSPSFSAAQLDVLAAATERRLDGIRNDPPSQRTLRVACVGRFSVNKNQAALVEAVSILSAENVSVEVRFAGSGGTEEEVRALVARLGLDEQVRFLGRQDVGALLGLWEWADVNATITEVEGFGRVTLEAMALGCPTVCGPGAMQGDLVGYGERGHQVDPPAASSVAAALRVLRGQPAEAWAEMAASCRLYAEAHTVEAFGAEVRDLLDDLHRRV